MTTAQIFALLFAAMPICQTEDSTNCAWDAAAQGNGRGTSFVSIGTTQGDLLIYADGATALFD